ncbi:MAG: CD1845 family protein [Oscillospiraceae bacterium]
MRIILKILATPFMLVLTLTVAVLSFLHSLAAWALGILALIFAVCGVFACTIGGDPAAGIQMLIIAFLVSPFGLPVLAEWLISKLDDLNYSLRCFITG